MTDLLPVGDRGWRAHQIQTERGATHPSDDAGRPEDAIEVREVLGVLRRRFWLLVACMMVGGAIGYAVHEIRDPIYRAHGVIRIDDPRNQMIEGMGGLAVGGRTQVDPVLSALQTLESQSVLGEIVDTEGLRLHPLDPGFSLTRLTDVHVLDEARPDTLLLRFAADHVTGFDLQTGDEVQAGYGEELVLPSVRVVVPGHPGVDRVRLELRDRQWAIRELSEDLRALRRESTDVVDVEFVSTDPEMSQRVVNRAAEVFRTRSADEARAESMRRRTFLEEQLAQVESTLQRSQQALSNFRSREQVFSSREWLSAQQAGLMEIDMRREELAADRDMYSEILYGLRESTPDESSERLEAVVASPEVAQNPVVGSLFGQLLEYETARDSLLNGPWGAAAGSPDVAWVNQQITGIQNRLEGAVRSHMDALDARIEALEQLRTRQATSMGELPQTEAEEARLVQEVESVRRTVEELTSEYYRAQVAEAVEEGPVQILDLAPLPLESEGAPLPLLLVLGAMFGVVIGTAGAFGLEMVNTRIRHEQDLEESLKVSAVGVIPRIEKRSRFVLARPKASRRTLPAAASTSDHHGGAPRTSAEAESTLDIEAAVVVLADRRSAAAEAYRSLRTNLLFANGRQDLKTLVVTSALPSEGKTTTAANLAVTFAQQGMKVLAVDCDLRKPRLAQLFGLPRTPGMADLALERAEASHVIREFPAVEGLHVVPGGYMTDVPTELLGGARMRGLLEVLGDRFDMVVLDTPPLSAGADAAVLGSAVDGVLLVVEAGQTDRDAARFAVRQLHTVGANVVGAVLNDPHGDVPKYGYYHPYAYYGDE